jgi:hypothetical protein
MLAPEHARVRVHGVLYRLRKSELKKLHSREHGYVLQEMEVSCTAGDGGGLYLAISGNN